MTGHKQELLEALRSELYFLRNGGYQPSVHTPRQELAAFRDSPSCLNHGLAVPQNPCSECWLIDFVPADKRGERLPCHFIPLNERGETIASLQGSPNDPKVYEALRGWLLENIAKLEREAPEE